MKPTTHHAAAVRRHKKAIDVARKQTDDEHEIDDEPKTSEGEGGVWVQSWVWVSNEEIES